MHRVKKCKFLFPVNLICVYSLCDLYKLNAHGGETLSVHPFVQVF